MDLDSAAEELYGVPAEEFGEHRKRLAAEAKAAGNKPLAASIGKLRKPVLAAALVNELVRDQPPELARLTQLGEQMRSAQRQLRGPDLRALSEQRQQLLQRLTDLVRDRAATAGRSVTEPVLAQVRSTFDAAIADLGAEAAALSGRLTTVLSYTGFGEVDVTDAVAAPVRTRHLRSVPTGGEPESAQSRPDRAADQAHQRRLERRRDELRRAEAEHAEAARALEEAEQDAEAADQLHQESTGRVQQLQAELSQAQERAWQAGQASRSAERVLRTAQQEAERTAAALQAARERLDGPGAG